MRTSHISLCVSSLALAAALALPAQSAAQPGPQQPETGQKPAGPKPKTQEIVVTGNRSDVVTGPDRVSFSIANDLQAQTGTVADALRAVPGVEVDLQGGVSLRGDPGVTILVDGRPSAMLSGESRGDVLLSMPAGQIERVEVITNPSAAMSPEGSAGAINLVTKRVQKGVRSGTLRATAGPRGRGSLNLSGSRSGAGLTLTADAGFRRFTAEPEATQLRSRLDPVSDLFVDSRQDSELKNKAQARTARFAAEYDLDKANRLSTELSYRDIGIDIDRSDRLVGDLPAASFSRESDAELSNRGFSARGSWRRRLGEDHELVADLEFEKARLRRDVEAVTEFDAQDPSFEHIRNGGDRRDVTTKLDYKRPLGDGSSLNVGYQGNFTKAEFDYVGERGASIDALLPIPALTNSFDYGQDIHAAFGTYRFELGKLETQAGLRVEQANTRINQITDDVQVENGYLRAYPTLHLSYKLTPTQQLRGSYSRRIQRPSPQDLNPYTMYIDPLNVRRGNPFLRPEVTDSLELGWQNRKAGTFYSLTLFYRRSRGGVTDVITDIGDGVFLTTRENLGSADRAGAEAVINGKLGKTISYNASGTLMRHKIDPRLNGISAARSGTTASARGNLNWQPTAKDFFQLNAIYGGKQLLPQGYRRSSGVLNLGYRRKVNDRLNLLLTAQDVLNTARQVTVFDTPTLRDKITQSGPGRVVLLGLTYSLAGQAKKDDQNFDFQQGAGETGQ